MKHIKTLVGAGIPVAAMIATSFAGTTGVAHADSANTWKDLAIAGAAVGVYGLLDHNKTAAVGGAIGAAVAYSQYQNASDNNRYYAYSGYDASGYDCNGYDRAGYDRNGFNHNGIDRNGHDRAYYSRVNNNHNDDHNRNWNRNDDHNRNRR